jgi:hypothetical protein
MGVEPLRAGVSREEVVAFAPERGTLGDRFFLDSAVVTGLNASVSPVFGRRVRRNPGNFLFIPVVSRPLIAFREPLP